jgi:hypothetical protein
MSEHELVPRMSQLEIGVLKSYLGLCRGHYYEFGCGGSTYIASLFPNIQSITSVDSSRKWIHIVHDQIAHKKVNMIYIDINGNDENWGKPKDKSKICNWPAYSNSIKSTNQLYDLVLIDGRFRVACALNTLSMIHPSSIVLIHDYNDRAYYHVIEQFYEILTKVDSMVVLKKKAKYDMFLVQSILKKYSLIFD